MGIIGTISQKVVNGLFTERLVNGLLTAKKMTAAWGDAILDNLSPEFVSAEVGLIDSYTIDANFNLALNEAKVPDAANYANTFPNVITPLIDWFLPSRDEWAVMKEELHNQPIPLGNLTANYYWASSELNATYAEAFAKYQTSYLNYAFPKGSTGVAVRAIRAFTSTTNYNIRDIGPAGGYVFWKDGNDYLECAPSDVSADTAWSNITNAVSGASGYAVGTGQANTTAIITQAGHTSSAAKLCDDLVVNNSTPTLVTGVSILGEHNYLTLNRAILPGEEGDIQYIPNEDEDKQLQGTNGNKVAAFTEGVTNNVAASIPVLVPPIIIADATPTIIKVPYDLALDETSTPATTAYVLGSGRTVSSLVVSEADKAIYLTVSSRYYWGDTETIAYTAPVAPNPMIKSTGGGEAASFTATAITNNVSLDSDASAGIAKVELTDALTTTQKQAADQLIQGLKADGLWTPMKACYLIIGGSASAHKWNWKDLRDLDEAFRLNFANSWVHAVTGATPDGITAYADTFFVPSTHLAFGSNHLSFYSRTNTAKGYDMGASEGALGGGNELVLICKYTNNQAYLSVDSTIYNCTIAVATGAGFLSGGIADVKNQRLYKNGSEVKAIASGGASVPGRKLAIGANLSGATYNLFGDKECAFASIGTGLTPTEHANLNTRVLAFQTKLSRNV